jgi:glycosyltransferase involved in cell wall biosynthesis
MRVALLTQNARAGDAIGRHVAEKAAYFLDRGAYVRVVVADDRDTHPALRSLTLRQSDRPSGDGWQALKSADLIVIDYSQFYPLLDFLPLLADGKRRLIFDYHGVTPPMGRLANHRECQLRGQEYRRCASIADVVITHSQFAERELLNEIAIPSQRRHRMGYVIDTDHFTPGEPNLSLRKRLALNGARILLVVGRLAPNKRVPILIRAVAELRDESPTIHAVIVGPCGDCYESERLLCREVAADCQVADRVHFLGAVDEATLRDCYRSADLLVLPSVHEGFCLPVIEAMACGLPVIAARAAALPETVCDTGLTFEPDNPGDLAQIVRRALSGHTESVFDHHRLDFTPEGADVCQTIRPKRVAIVTPALGETASGAERTLTLIAQSLAECGIAVTVFTTKVENPPPKLNVQQFPRDEVDPARRAAAVDHLQSGNLAEATYFANTLRSEKLVESLRRSKVDAVIVGPFGNALTRDVIRLFGNRAILVPCLHDEPVASTTTVRRMFQDAGGILYHSPEERKLAQIGFGFNHPNSEIIGTWIDMDATGDRRRGRASAGTDRYVLVLGRKVREKGLSEVITKARDYARQRSSGFRFVFAGDGDFPIPSEPWATDLGRVSEIDKRDLIAGSAALIQFSPNESLSLVVLEAMAAGTPVIVSAENPVLAVHVQNGIGGWEVSDTQEFISILDGLWNDPKMGSHRGQSGREYARRQFGNRKQLTDAVVRAFENYDRPCAELMREKGLAHAKLFCRDKWRTAMDNALDALIDRPAMAPSDIEFTTRESKLQDAKTWRLVVHLRSGLPLFPTGPARSQIVIRIRAADGEVIGDEISASLSGILVADQSMPIDVMVPRLAAGEYGLEAGLRTLPADAEPHTEWFGVLSTLNVTASPTNHVLPARKSSGSVGQLNSLREVQQLPDDYVDVTTGRFARIKRLIKKKVLQNFRAGYIDVLARQQSRFNRCVIDALEELADQPPNSELRAELATTQAQCSELRDRLHRMEAAVQSDFATIGEEP